MKLKNILFTIALAILMICGIYASILMAGSEPTYDGSKTDVVALYENPESYDNSQADGVASIIVNENLDKTAAQNVVFSVVFNFRGYDTMGESFILIAAIAGSLVILRKSVKGAEEAPEQKEEEEA
ncbi:MAG: hydrogen gas-evolving membrane-bound hydrogenase subunit E [Candidatus Onthomonas sp.]